MPTTSCTTRLISILRWQGEKLNLQKQMTKNTVDARLAKLRKQQQKLVEKEQVLVSQSRELKLSKILKLIDEYELNFDEEQYLIKRLSEKVGYRKSQSIRSAQVQIPKGITYVNPENLAQTWSGKGRPPNWLRELAIVGKTDHAIQKLSSD
jgi:DNA-binding protein H-NS